MVVPARPVANSPIAVDWGDVVHNGAVAMDFQSGRASPPSSGAGEISSSLTVTFPRQFGGVPVVVITTDNFNWYAGLSGLPATASSFTFAVRRIGQSNGASCGCAWFAYGPRA